MKLFLIVLSVLILILIAYMLVQNSRSKAQGVDGKGLFECHWKPNCISSKNKQDEAHYYPAFELNENKFEQLISNLKKSSNIQVIKIDGFYIHAVASTKIGFKDDIEFYFDTEKGLCHIRSISRVGRKDFGVNKNRMDNILKQLNA